MQQELKRVVHTGCERFTTAHAGSEGVSLVTFEYLDGAQAVEIASVLRYSGRAFPIFRKEFFKSLNQARMDEERVYHEDEQVLADLSKFRSFGESSNVNELADEKIAYGVRGDEVPFLEEVLDFNDAGTGDERKFTVPGELRGFSEVHNPSAPRDDLPEPFTVEEGLEFVRKLLKGDEYDVTLDELDSTLSVDLWLRPEFETAVEKLKMLMKKMVDDKENPNMLLLYLGISDTDWRRAQITLRRDSLGDDWCWQSYNNIGTRNGTIEDQSRQNDRNYTTQDQYHTWGERVDGRFVLSQELEIASRKNMAVVWSMYYKAGEIKPDGSEAKHLENKGWTERSVYFMRCAAARDELCAEKLWHILTWPLDVVQAAMPHLRQAYKNSVMQHRSGPGRQQVNGRWVDAPLVGQAAIAHIRKVGVGDLKGKKINKDVRLHIGSEWHKLFLNRKHLDTLEDALLWREGTIKLRVGEEEIQEKFEQRVSSLPRDYVAKTYGKR